MRVDRSRSDAADEHGSSYVADEHGSSYAFEHSAG
jgi:hypothetical protein